MSFPPIVNATLQSSLLAATSNLIAQALTAYKKDESLAIDWVPVFQFVFFAIISTPPNFLWQEFLESTFPAVKPRPTREAIASAAANDDEALDKEAREGKLVEPGKLNINNTIAKLLLDQTVGSAVNTVLFSVFLHSVQAAMAHRPASAVGPRASFAFVTSGRALDYSAVRWDDVFARARAEFVPLLTAGWRLWPIVSLVNFAFVETVEMRNLVGGLAGVGWGVYVSLFAAAH